MRVPLARRRRVNNVKLVPVSGKEFQRVALVEFLAAIMRLRADVHADYVVASAAVAFGCPACSTEEIK